MLERTRLQILGFALVVALAGVAAPVLAQEPAATEPAAQEPAPQDPALQEPALQEPAATEPAAAEPTPAQTAEPAAGNPPTTITGAVGSAAGEMAEAAQAGTAGVRDQGKALWSEALVPMWERFAAALPVLLKALLILAVAWILALALGAGTTKLLSLTTVDERAARDWGLGRFLENEKGEKTTVDELGGAVVKWVILLLGFVAFFDALELQMVAGPLQGVVSTILGLIPALLKAFVILLVAWIVASILKMLTTRGLHAVGFDQRTEKYFPPREVKGETVMASSMIGRLVFYAVLLFALPPFLEALGQQSLVAPLTGMLTTALGYIPNIVAAIVLVGIGMIVATVVREIATNFLAAVGADRMAARVGFGRSEGVKPVSEIAGTVAYFFILVPVIVAAVDALKIEAISTPVRNTLEQLLSAVPLIFGGLIVVAIGYYIANTVRGIVTSFLSGVGFDALPSKFGLHFLQPKDGGASLSAIGGTVVMALILLLTAEQALATLNLDRLSLLVGDLIRYLPNLAVGLVVILAALSIGNYVGNLVSSALGGSEHQALLSNIARYAIIFLGASMGLSQLGVGEGVVQMVVAAVVGGAALAVGLAFGLGGRDRAQALLERSRDA